MVISYSAPKSVRAPQKPVANPENPPNYAAWTSAICGNLNEVRNTKLASLVAHNPTQFKKYSMLDSIGLMTTPNIMGTVGEVLRNWPKIQKNFKLAGVETLHTYIESENASLRIRQKKYSIDELHAELKGCIALLDGDKLLVTAIPAGEVLYNANAIVQEDGSILAEFCKGKLTPARGAAIAFSLEKNKMRGICFPRVSSNDPVEKGIAVKLLQKLPRTDLNGGTYETYLPGYYEFGVVKMPDGRIRLSFYDYTNNPLFLA